jgi:hypothetical protein
LRLDRQALQTDWFGRQGRVSIFAQSTTEGKGFRVARNARCRRARFVVKNSSRNLRCRVRTTQESQTVDFVFLQLQSGFDGGLARLSKLSAISHASVLRAKIG